jgi:Flp pilus assembly pilin Flp
MYDPDLLINDNCISNVGYSAVWGESMDMKIFGALLNDETGATAVEYAILVSLIAGVIAATVAILGGKVSALFSSVNWW